MKYNLIAPLLVVALCFCAIPLLCCSPLRYSFAYPFGATLSYSFALLIKALPCDSFARHIFSVLFQAFAKLFCS